MDRGRSGGSAVLPSDRIGDETLEKFRGDHRPAVLDAPATGNSSIMASRYTEVSSSFVPGCIDRCN